MSKPVWSSKVSVDTTFRQRPWTFCIPRPKRRLTITATALLQKRQEDTQDVPFTSINKSVRLRLTRRRSGSRRARVRCGVPTELLSIPVTRPLREEGPPGPNRAVVPPTNQTARSRDGTL
ncbi:hypothetical protein FQA47_024180 [Oryzias melastigma]|uniref:Uncharacterized protein n=1 Tax=Oryzias melastigma TaxID=30732 RepID=A0A834FQK6_ORYME|nr:hypothetical protein FQA47_024180 [Oryzias melastigma]